MALPASGQLKASDINTELGNAVGTTVSMNSSAVRTLFGVASGQIKMSDGYGASSGPSYPSLPAGYTTLFDSSTYGAGTATSFKNLMAGTTACYGWASNCYTLDSNGVNAGTATPTNYEIWFPVSGGNSTIGLNGQTYFMIFGQSGQTAVTSIESGRTSSESINAASVTNDQSPFNLRFDDSNGGSLTVYIDGTGTYNYNKWYTSTTSQGSIYTNLYSNMIAAGYHIRVSWDG